MKTKTRENERRDSIIVIILILLLGFVCIIITSGWALRFAPSWKLDTNMRSNLNPNSDFLTSRPVSFFEPLDSAILTQPSWLDTFLTPGASFETRIPLPTATVTSVPPKTNTPVTPTVIPSATNTLVIVSPTNTKATFPPPPPSTITNTPVPVPPSANLSITKTDGVTTITAGSSTTYTVRVTNLGPSNVTGAILSDPFATGLSKTAVACSATPGRCVTAPTIVQLEAGTFALPALASGQFYEITITANVTALSGTVTNIAAISAPVGTVDPIPGNDSASDTDTVTPLTNLAITKDDGSLTYTAGNPITYTIVVTNAGPSSAIGASVADTIPVAITGTTINCVASGTANCGTNASAGNALSYTGVNIPAGAGNFLTISVSGTVNAATTGNLANTATVTAGAGQIDPTPGNNTATDTDTQFIPPSADLQITKTDGATEYVGGIAIQYTIFVSNPAGPGNILGATVADTFSTSLTSITWTCAALGGASCSGSGSGNINDTVNLPAASSVTYTVNATVIASPSGNLVNTATVTLPTGATDPNLGNNSSTDTNTLIVVDSPPPGVEVGGPPDGSTYDVIAPACLTLHFPLTVSGNSGFDFAYFEYPNGSGVLMDRVIVYVSDGRNWYPIFNWGDEIADTNSNLNFNTLLPPVLPPFPPPQEQDERDILASDLYTDPISGFSTGIAMDLDLVVPAGMYPYVRFCAPFDGFDNAMEIDAITRIP